MAEIAVRTSGPLQATACLCACPAFAALVANRGVGDAAIVRNVRETVRPALVGHLTYPLAPPRMRPDSGLVDTGVRFGQSVYGADRANHGLLNQYAAMPSLHIAWAVLFAVTAVTAVTAVVATRSRWRWLAPAYPTATTWVVVVTANHYWLDGIVGVLLLGVAIAVVGRLCRPG